MKANKRIRDLKRRSKRRLYIHSSEFPNLGVTTYPVDEGKKTNDVQEERRR